MIILVVFVALDYKLASSLLVHTFGILSCMVLYSLCHGMDIGARDIVHWSAAPHHRIAYRTGLGCALF